MLKGESNAGRIIKSSSKWFTLFIFCCSVTGYSQSLQQRQINSIMAAMFDTTSYVAHPMDSTVSRIPALRIGAGITPWTINGFISYFKPKTCLLKLSYGTELPGNKIIEAEGWAILGSTSKMKEDRAVLKHHVFGGYGGGGYSGGGFNGGGGFHGPMTVDIAQTTELPTEHVQYYALHAGYFTRDLLNTPTFADHNNEPKAFTELAFGASIIWAHNLKYLVTAPSQKPQLFHYHSISSFTIDLLYYPAKPAMDTTGFAQNLQTPLPLNSFSSIGVRFTYTGFTNFFYYKLAIENNTFGFGYMVGIGLCLSMLNN
jgi:hypothetical protein